MNSISALLQASNRSVPNKDVFTEDLFIEYMPQFYKEELKTDSNGNEYKVKSSLVPSKALENFINMANLNILQCRWFEKWEYACALYIAHHCTLYLRNYREASERISDVTDTAGNTGMVSSVSLGDASTSYDNSLVTQSMQKYGLLGTTPYGQQLATESKLLGLGMAYMI